MKLRKCVIHEDYMDGIMGLFVDKVKSYHEEYTLMPAEVVEEFERAEAALLAAEKRLRKAWANARVVKRRKRKELDE